MARISVLFENGGQELELWCWAAVAANVFNSSRLGDAAPFFERTRQCEVARDVFAFAMGQPAVQDPCASKETFNDIRPLALALGTKSRGVIVPAFADVVTEISNGASPGASVNPAGNPVCAEIKFRNNTTGNVASHFIAISSADTTTQHVWVEDPLYGPNNLAEFAFNDFVANYDFRDPVTPGDPVVIALQKVAHT